MQSPFPGMDPFVEHQAWSDFHASFNVALRAEIQPQLGDRFFARVERDVVIEPSDAGESFGSRLVRVPDVAVVETVSPQATDSQATRQGSNADILELELPSRVRSYLTIRSRAGDHVAAVIETLSPTNKQPGAGRRRYLAKRDEVLASTTQLVELDLLLGGSRFPPLDAFDGTDDYFAVVSDWRTRPRLRAYRWDVMQPMPTIGLPLCIDGRDETAIDVTIDLQRSLHRVWELGFGAELRYDRPLPVTIAETVRDRVAAQLAAAG